jgi:hypothetical protein
VPTRVFISYRRQDTAPAAGRVYDRLCRLPSKPDVFFDVSTIAGGEDFVTKVTTAVQECDAVLVMIGHKWLEPGTDGTMRIREAGDHVHAEVRVALERAPMVLPVLVDGAPMPRLEQLPEAIQGLARRNALPLRHESFDDDVEKILTTILGAAATRRPWDERGSPLVKLGYSIAGMAVALMLLVAGALVHRGLWDRPLSASIGDGATTLVLIAGAALGAWLGLLVASGRRRRRLRGA